MILSPGYRSSSQGRGPHHPAPQAISRLLGSSGVDVFSLSLPSFTSGGGDQSAASPGLDLPALSLRGVLRDPSLLFVHAVLSGPDWRLRRLQRIFLLPPAVDLRIHGGPVRGRSFDTIIKGHDYYYRHQLAYNSRAAAYVLLCLIAIKVRRPWFHAAFAVFALAYEIAFILEMYRTIG